MRFSIALSASLVLGLAANAAVARDSLGIYEQWGAFRDPGTPRCYATAKPISARTGDWQPFAAIGYWPRRNVGGQVHFRLRRAMAQDAEPVLEIGGRRFALIGSGPDAWAADRRADAAIVAAIRSGLTMRIEARSESGTRMVDGYDLSGAASAIDAAALGCTRQ